jgi:hypothetical protein
MDRLKEGSYIREEAAWHGLEGLRRGILLFLLYMVYTFTTKYTQELEFSYAYPEAGMFVNDPEPLHHRSKPSSPSTTTTTTAAAAAAAAIII